MLQALKEMFRDQPHLVFITFMVCLLSCSGIAYLIGNYFYNRRRNVTTVDPPENVWTKPTVEEHLPRRRPVAGQPRHTRPTRQVVIVRVENSPPREPLREAPKDPPANQKEEQEEQSLQPQNSLNEAVSLAVGSDSLQRSGQVRPHRPRKPLKTVESPGPLEQIKIPDPTESPIRDSSSLRNAVNLVLNLEAKPREKTIRSNELPFIPSQQEEVKQEKLVISTSKESEAIQAAVMKELLAIKENLLTSTIIPKQAGPGAEVKNVEPLEKSQEETIVQETIPVAQTPQAKPVTEHPVIVKTEEGTAVSLSESDRRARTNTNSVTTFNERPETERRSRMSRKTKKRSWIKNIDAKSRPGEVTSKEAIQITAEKNKEEKPADPIIESEGDLHWQDADNELNHLVEAPVDIDRIMLKNESGPGVGDQVEAAQFIEMKTQEQPETEDRPAANHVDVKTELVTDDRSAAELLVDDNIKKVSEEDPEAGIQANANIKKVASEDRPEADLLTNPNVKKASEDRFRGEVRYVGYEPNKIFAQPEPWRYPYVSMPAAGCVIRTPRTYLSRKKEPVEEMFQLEMRRIFPAFEIAGNACLPVPGDMPAYEPNISLIVKGLSLNLFLDVEIDEPYDSVTRAPKHTKNEDWLRDLWFTNRGWIVVRFAEEQVKKQPKHCLAFIAKVIHSVYPEYHIPSHLKNMTDPKFISQWTNEEATQMAIENKREEYLNTELKNQYRPEPKAHYSLELNETEIMIESIVQSR